jgi:serine/threonine protein kinase
VRQPIPFGKYVLLDRVSVGGMAEVFKAKSYGVEGFEKVIAIKRILPSMGEDRDFIKMFIDEAKIAGQLAHANICQIFELGRIDSAHFIAMEYIWGKDLLQIQNRFRRLKQVMSVPMACYVIAKACEGLDYAHRKRDPLGKALEIVHRDCSPQNVLVSYEGEVKIIDFGIAKAASRSSRTMAGVLKGKFGYMSPEQVRGLPLDRRSDIFALGTILYESLTGERLFQGESDFSTLEKVRNVEIPPPRQVNRNIPEDVERIVMKALARDPQDRYQWCNEMHADLQRHLMAESEVYTAKRLGMWLKQGFEGELSRERSAMEKYKRMGRDGLIAGKPQAAAKLDIVEHLGEAGQAEGDPTILGGPSIEDMIADADPQLAAVLRAQQRRAGSQSDAQDFGEELPTEIFGEIAEDDLISVVTEDRPMPPAGMPPQMANAALHQANQVLGHQPMAPAPAQPFVPGGAGYNAAAAVAPVFTPSGMAAVGPAQFGAPYQGGGMGMTGAPGVPLGHGMPLQPVPSPPGMPALGTDPMFGSTSSVAPLPTPSAVRALNGKKRRRPSLAKDIGIGIGIAALVLALFAVGKYAFFGDKPGTQEAEAAEYGTILVTVPDDDIAEVFVNDERRGMVEQGALTLESVVVGAYRVAVRRTGADGCEEDVTLEPGKVKHIKCTFEPPEPTGRIVLDGLTAEHSVFVDGQQMDSDKPLEVKPDVEHSVVVMLGDTVVEELVLTVEEGKEQRRALSGASASIQSSAVHDDVEPSSDDTTLARADDKDDKDKDDKKTDRDKDRRDKDKKDKRDKDKKDVKDKKDKRDKKDVKDKKDKKDKATKGKGWFMAYTTPWARVYIDGKDTGKMTPIAPRAKIALKPGKHKVTFVVGKQKFHYWIVIEAGKDYKLVKDLDVKDDDK